MPPLVNLRSVPTDDPSTEPAAISLPVTTYAAGVLTVEQDWISTEVPVQISFDGQAYAVMMATPHDLEDFARGFARTEAGLTQLEQIRSIKICSQLEGLELQIQTDGAPLQVSAQRALTAPSGCGICGSRSLDTVLRVSPPIHDQLRISADAIEAALAGLRQSQASGRLTGALHAAAWCSLRGELQLIREDVGRHNALDKLLGAMWAQNMPINQGFLLVTSRASYEMVAKAAIAGIAIMVAISAPTALAIRHASSHQLSLIGFARPGRCVIYTHPHRFSDIIAGPAD